MLFELIHSFTNIFADGRSDIKTSLFFLYLLFLGLVYILIKRNKPKNLNWLYFGITIIAMYIYGLALQIFYTISNGIPFTKQIITGNNGEMSYSSIWHIHISKACVGIIFPHLDKIDTGGAYLGLFPNWLFLIGLLILITLLIQSVIYFTTSFRCLLEKYNLRQKIALIFAYGILSFSFIKTSVDGGIFYPAIIIGSIFIFLFILRDKNKLPKYHYYITTSISIILFFISYYLNNFLYGSGWLVIQSATIISLYNIIFYTSEKKINIKLLVLFITIFLINWYSNAYHDFGIYKYSQVIVPNNETVYYYNKQTEKIDTLQGKTGQTISALSNQLKRNINYLPIQITNITCKKYSSYGKNPLILISKNPISKESFNSDYININVNSTRFQNNSWKTYITYNRKSCVPEYLSLINGELKNNNVTSYLYYAN